MTVDVHEHFIRIPLPIPVSTHPTDRLTADLGHEHQAQTVPPKPNGFMVEVDAALKEKISYIPQRQWNRT